MWSAGLMLVLLYGREGWFAPLIRATGFNIVFAFPGQSLEHHVVRWVEELFVTPMQWLAMKM